MPWKRTNCTKAASLDCAVTAMAVAANTWSPDWSLFRSLRPSWASRVASFLRSPKNSDAKR